MPYSNRLSLAKQRGFSLLELCAVTVVIGILIFSGYRVYLDQIEQSRKRIVEFQGAAFFRMVSNLHALSLGTKQSQIELNGSTIYFNEYAYPASANVGSPSINNQTHQECKSLWLAFFRKAEIRGRQNATSLNMDIWHTNTESCRYAVRSPVGQIYFFDYFYKTGKVTNNIDF